MNEKLEELHTAVTALRCAMTQLRRENSELKHTAAQFAAQYRQLTQQHEEERTQFWAYREEARQMLAQTAQRLRELLATLPDGKGKGGER